MQAESVKPRSSQDGSAADPWRCLRACDKESSCRGIFITKPNSTWTCWFVRGSFGLGSTASSVKGGPKCNQRLPVDLVRQQLPNNRGAFVTSIAGTETLLQMSHTLLLAVSVLASNCYSGDADPNSMLHVTFFRDIIAFCVPMQQKICRSCY